MPDTPKTKDDKWEFEDYAYTITAILVGFLLVVPEILYSQWGIIFMGGSMSGGEVAEQITYGVRAWRINELRALSPMLFLSTTALCFIYDAVEARRTGGYRGSLFTYTYEGLVEDAIYMTITTVMVFGAVLMGSMYISWLAGPITWGLFMVIWPLVKKTSRTETEEPIPWGLLGIFAFGIFAEVLTGAWVAFPLAWLVICAVKLIRVLRAGLPTIDDVFDALYFAFSVLLMAAGIIFGSWVASWTAFIVALVLCWMLSKFGRYKKQRDQAQ